MEQPWGYEPYCGPAPTPASLWLSWNLDPVLLIVLALATGGAVVLQRERQPAYLAAMAVLFIAFVSPFCALTVALFSARAGHHLLLVSAVAPLLAMALRPRVSGSPPSVAALVGISAVVLWVWHLPAAYAWALSNAAAYWLMQASLLGTAVLLWSAVFAARPGTAVGALLASAVQMGLLGALLTFASRPLYAPHFATTLAFDLAPLTDQQLAGLLMWVPGGLPYVIAAVVLVSRRLTALEDGR